MVQVYARPMSDWFDGSRTAAREIYPNIQVRRGIEHMRCNLKSNQTAGSQGRRPRRAKAKAQPWPKATEGGCSRPSSRPATLAASINLGRACPGGQPLVRAPSRVGL